MKCTAVTSCVTDLFFFSPLISVQLIANLSKRTTTSASSVQSRTIIPLGNVVRFCKRCESYVRLYYCRIFTIAGATRSSWVRNVFRGDVMPISLDLPVLTDIYAMFSVPLPHVSSLEIAVIHGFYPVRSKWWSWLPSRSLAQPVHLTASCNLEKLRVPKCPETMRKFMRRILLTNVH